MQTSHGIALPRKRINDDTIQTLQGGQKSVKKRRKVSDVAKQITLDYEQILAKFDDVKKEITRIIMEEKEDPKYEQSIKYQIVYHITFYKLIGEVITDPPIVFKSPMERLMGNSSADELEEQLITSYKDNIEKEIDEFTENGSGWVFLKISKIMLSIYGYAPLPGGSSYLPTPKKLAGKRAIVSVQNRDNKCFLWSILAALHVQIRHSEILSRYKPYENELNDEELEYLVKTNSIRISKFEVRNNLSINIYSYNDKYEILPLRISDVYMEGRHIDLILIRNDEGDTHYAWIKNMSRLLNGNKGYRSHRGRSFTCPRCLTKSYNREKFLIHKEICNSLSITQRVKYPVEKNNEIKKIFFDQFKKMWPVPFVVYADFESCLKVFQDDTNGKTQKYREHVPISYALSVASVDPHWNREIKCFTGSDCMENFMSEIDKLLEEIKAVFSKAMPIKKLTGEQTQQHANTTQCFLCKKQFSDTNKSAKKQTDHCHITGEYRGAACHYCNLQNLSLRRIPIPVVFHNLKGYDMHHIIRNAHDQCVEIIASSKEQISMAKIYVKDEEDDGGEEIAGETDDGGNKPGKSRAHATYNDSLSF